MDSHVILYTLLTLSVSQFLCPRWSCCSDETSMYTSLRIMTDIKKRQSSSVCLSVMFIISLQREHSFVMEENAVCLVLRSLISPWDSAWYFLDAQ